MIKKRLTVLNNKQFHCYWHQRNVTPLLYRTAEFYLVKSVSGSTNIAWTRTHGGNGPHNFFSRIIMDHTGTKAERFAHYKTINHWNKNACWTQVEQELQTINPLHAATWLIQAWNADIWNISRDVSHRKLEAYRGYKSGITFKNTS